MQVKKIIEYVTLFLQYKKLQSFVSDETIQLTDTETKDLNLIVSCVNLVNNIIATDYINLKSTIEIESDGIVEFSQISGNIILDICKITDLLGNKVLYKITSSGIRTAKGKLLITYSYYPNDVSFNGSITCYHTKLNERIFAYGVTSEYLFVKGNIEDATMWDKRFKQSMLSSIRDRGSIIIPPRSN